MRHSVTIVWVLGLAVILGSPAFAQIPYDGAISGLSHDAREDKVTQPLLVASRHSSHQSAEEVSKPPLKIQVRLRDYARVPKWTLARAIRKATQIFQSARVEIQWIRCQLSAERLLEDQECKERLSPDTLLLSILPQSMVAKLSARHETFGYALPLGGGDFGFLAAVFFHRVVEMADWRGDNASCGLILGHVMAHEIGHLLLGPESHSATGIMSVPWRPKDLERAAMGGLRFTPQQAQEMRAQVRDRIRAEGAPRGRDSPGRAPCTTQPLPP